MGRATRSAKKAFSRRQRWKKKKRSVFSASGSKNKIRRTKKTVTEQNACNDNYTHCHMSTLLWDWRCLACLKKCNSTYLRTNELSFLIPCLEINRLLRICVFMHLFLWCWCCCCRGSKNCSIKCWDNFIWLVCKNFVSLLRDNLFLFFIFVQVFCYHFFLFSNVLGNVQTSHDSIVLIFLKVKKPVRLRSRKKRIFKIRVCPYMTSQNPVILMRLDVLR